MKKVELADSLLRGVALVITIVVLASSATLLTYVRNLNAIGLLNSTTCPTIGLALSVIGLLGHLFLVVTAPCCPISKSVPKVASIVSLGLMEVVWIAYAVVMIAAPFRFLNRLTKKEFKYYSVYDVDSKDYARFGWKSIGFLPKLNLAMACVCILLTAGMIGVWFISNREETFGEKLKKTISAPREVPTGQIQRVPLETHVEEGKEAVAFAQ